MNRMIEKDLETALDEIMSLRREISILKSENDGKKMSDELLKDLDADTRRHRRFTAALAILAAYVQRDGRSHENVPAAVDAADELMAELGI